MARKDKTKVEIRVTRIPDEHKEIGQKKLEVSIDGKTVDGGFDSEKEVFCAIEAYVEKMPKDWQIEIVFHTLRKDVDLLTRGCHDQRYTSARNIGRALKDE